MLLAPQALWLLRERGRATWAPVAIPTLALAPLAALVLAQGSSRASWIEGVALTTRLAQIPGGFVVGYQLERAISVAIGLPLIAVLALALWRSLGTRGGRAMLVLGAIGIAVPLLGAAVGQDYIVQRYVIGSLVALVLAAAIGFGRLRHGVVLAGAVCAAWVAITLATAGDPKFRREDWRAAVHATRGAQALVIVPHSATPVTTYYRGGITRVARADVTSLAVVLMGQTTGSGCAIPPSPPAPGVPDRVLRGTCWEVDLRRWPSPRTLVAGDQTLLR